MILRKLITIFCSIFFNINPKIYTNASTHTNTSTNTKIHIRINNPTDTNAHALHNCSQYEYRHYYSVYINIVTTVFYMNTNTSANANM